MKEQQYPGPKFNNRAKACRTQSICTTNAMLQNRVSTLLPSCTTASQIMRWSERQCFAPGSLVCRVYTPDMTRNSDSPSNVSDVQINISHSSNVPVECTDLGQRVQSTSCILSRCNFITPALTYSRNWSQKFLMHISSFFVPALLFRIQVGLSADCCLQPFSSNSV